MDVEYTGRQTVVTDEMRTLAGPFLDRLEKMLGRGASAHVVVTAEKHRQVAEVTVKSRRHDLVGLSETPASLESALRQALEKAEAQAIRFKEKRATQKRLPKDEKSTVETALARPGRGKRTSLLATTESPLDEALGLQPEVPKNAVLPVPLAKNGNGAHEHEPHVIRAIDALALRPMSLEEAVKELETSNREIFVYRDRCGLIRILHCRRDSVLELIELP